MCEGGVFALIILSRFLLWQYDSPSSRITYECGGWAGCPLDASSRSLWIGNLTSYPKDQISCVVAGSVLWVFSLGSLLRVPGLTTCPPPTPVQRQNIMCGGSGFTLAVYSRSLLWQLDPPAQKGNIMCGGSVSALHL